jgi:hypothetical protein
MLTLRSYNNASLTRRGRRRNCTRNFMRGTCNSKPQSAGFPQKYGEQAFHSHWVTSRSAFGSTRRMATPVGFSGLGGTWWRRPWISAGGLVLHFWWAFASIFHVPHFSRHLTPHRLGHRAESGRRAGATIIASTQPFSHTLSEVFFIYKLDDMG